MGIPIYENDERVGTLQVSVQGLYTVFLAQLPPKRAVEASISHPQDGNGENRNGRLIAAPTEKPGDCAQSLSRLWILGRNGCAQDLGLFRPGKERRTFFRKLSRLECSRLPSAPVKALILPNGEKPAIPPKEEELQKSELRIPHSEFSWRRLPDGSLIDPKRRLLALPWAGEKLPRGTRRIRKNGMEYWVFRY